MARRTKLVRCLVLIVLGIILEADTISNSDIGDKPGRCPQVNIVLSSSIIGGGLGRKSVSTEPCEDLCLNDYDCQGVKKCCSGSCGRVCMSPEAEKPGTCPRAVAEPRGSIVGGGLNRRSISTEPCEDLCLNDFDCQGVEKCCSGYCGKICLTPEVDKPGTCPLPTLVPPSIDVSGERSRPYNFVHQAGSTVMLLPTDFVGSGKSRQYNTIVGGGHSGPSSVGGGLPGMSGSTFGDGRSRPSSSRHGDGRSRPSSSRYGDSRSWPSSSRNGGGRPRPSTSREGAGPPPQLVSSIVGGGLDRRSRSADDCQDQCLNDFDCDRDKKCCRGSCGRICLGPLAEKPGTCPLVMSHRKSSIVGGGLNRKSSSPEPCEDLCLNDYNCQGVKKCCSGLCGKECMSPGGEKPGTCPKSEIRAYGSIVGGGLGKRSSSRTHCEDSCLNDFDCETEKKCCDGPCGKNCLDPLELST